MRTGSVSLAVLVLAMGGGAEAAPVAQTVEAVLAANHAAVGQVPAKGTAEYRWTYAGSGLTGTATHTSDVATGAYVDSLNAGVLSTGEGFDGKTPWMRDISGANTSQEGGDRVIVATNTAYRDANLWWRADRGGAQVEYLGREPLDGVSTDHIAVTPRGGRRFEAWFDADSHLLLRTAEPKMFFKTRVFYADYRREGTVMVAHTVTSDPGTGEASYDHLKLETLTFGPARPLSAYARPTVAPTGASLAGGASSLTVPFRLLNNHIYVQAKVNGKGPYTFIVDTGGHNLLSPRIVAEAGLRKVGEIAMSGAGDKTSSGGFAEGANIEVGEGVKLADQVAFVTEIYRPEIEGIPVDGMVGFELFRRMAVTIDYGAQTLTFTDPAKFAAPADAGAAIPFKFYDHLPFVAGFLDDIPANFDIDSGSRSEMDITGPTVAKHGLKARFSKGVSAITGWGVGGPSRSYTVRLPSVTLGHVKVDGPTAGLSEDKGGSMSDGNYQANIGSGFLKRFVVTFDYAHQRMWLKPIAPTPVDAGRFDRSGMWINADKGGYEVTAVSAGGPADEAGLKAGDVIVSLDGQPAVAEKLSDARILLRARPAGSKIEAQVRRDGAERTVAITLRDQI